MARRLRALLRVCVALTRAAARASSPVLQRVQRPAIGAGFLEEDVHHDCSSQHRSGARSVIAG